MTAQLFFAPTEVEASIYTPSLMAKPTGFVSSCSLRFSGSWHKNWFYYQLATSTSCITSIIQHSTH